MVRVNLINPTALADQHLVAEYLEILMLVSYVKKHSSLENIPETYRLGAGHILFFKNKFRYLKKRHELIKKEMRKRRFATKKSLKLTGLTTAHKKNWRPRKEDKEIIKKRLIWKIKNKPGYYRYYGEKKSVTFFVEKIRKG